MDATNRFAIPFPEDTDPPDGPAQIEGAVEAIEDRLGYAGAQGGKSVIATEQSRTNTAYGELGTPDRVSGLVLPTDGLILVLFHGLFKCSVNSAGRAALFLDEDQIQLATGSVSPPAVVAARPITENNYYALASCAQGIARGPFLDSHVTTGQVLPQGHGTTYSVSGDQPAHFGLCSIFAAAGTYDVSVRFAATSGSVTAKERKLWAWTKEFPTSGV